MRSLCRVLIKRHVLSVYDENSQFACPAHANCFGTSSMSLVQRQRRCDGRTHRAETVEQRDGGWRNEDAVVQQLERPVCTAQTDNPVPGHASTCTPSPHIDPMQLRVNQVCQAVVVLLHAAHNSRCSVHDPLQLLSVTDFGAPANSRLQ